MRQGLLHLGATMLQTPGGFGNGLGAGIETGLLAMNRGADKIEDRKLKALHWQAANGDPAGLREFNAFTQGLTEEEKRQARRVRLGLDGRASSAGYGFDTITGEDGRERQTRQNPRTGALEVLANGRWVEQGRTPVSPMPGGEGMPGTGFAGGVGTSENPLPPGGGDQVVQAVLAEANRMTQAGRPPEQIDEWVRG